MIVLKCSTHPDPNRHGKSRRESLVFKSLSMRTSANIRRSGATYRRFVLNGLEMALEDDKEEIVEFEGLYRLRSTFSSARYAID